MKKYTLTLLLTAAPLFAGTPAPVAPAPQYNSEQGFTLGLEAMALKAYHSEGSYDDNNYDFAGRGSVGYQFADGLFVKATYFGYGTDVVDYSETDGRSYWYTEDGRLTASYIDLVVGQNFKPTETLKLSPYVGLRWADLKEGYHENERYSDGDFWASGYSNHFSGLGVVVGIDATRMLASNFSLYGTAKTSIVFGTTDSSHDSDYWYGEDTAQLASVGNGQEGSYSYSDDTVAFISELGVGVQYDFCFSNVAANIRAGVEGQWWAGLSNGDSENIGLAGFVLGANFRF